MAEGRKQTVFHFHIHNVRESDNTENRNETTLVGPNIDQLNITQQDEATNDGTRRKQKKKKKEKFRELTSSSTESDGTALRRVDEHDKVTQGADKYEATNDGTRRKQKRDKGFTSSSTESDGTALRKVDEHDKVIQGADKYSTTANVRRESGNSIPCEILKGRAITLSSQSKFAEATSYLEKLTKLQALDVNMTLMKMECDLHVGKERKIDQTIDDVRQSFMKSPSDVDEVYNFACDLLSGKSYVRAIILLRISSDMYKRHPSLSPDDIVEGIRKCVGEMSNAIQPMIRSGNRSKVIALDYGLPYMIEMVDDLRAVANCNPDVKAKHVAYCVTWVGFNYVLANENEKSIEFRQFGLDVMERQFGQNASKYQIYGILLHNIGVANYNLDKYKIAENYYLKAIDATK